MAGPMVFIIPYYRSNYQCRLSVLRRGRTITEQTGVMITDEFFTVRADQHQYKFPIIFSISTSVPTRPLLFSVEQSEVQHTVPVLFEILNIVTLPLAVLFHFSARS